MDHFSETGQLRELQHPQQRRERIGVSNLAKLGYQRVFYQRERSIAMEELGPWQKSHSLKHFHSVKQIHDQGIRKFKAQYGSQEGEPVRRRRRGYSIDNETFGAYYLNNWLSHEDFPCERPAPQEKTALLIYQLLAMRWNKALELVNSLPRTTQTSTLEYVLNCFKAVSSLLTEDDRFFADHFLERAQYQIHAKISSESVGGYYNFISVFEDESRGRFAQIRNSARKVQILKTNLDYLIKFAGSYKPSTDDPYLQFAWRMLGNNFDQESQNQKHDEDDFCKLLVRLDLKLSDRLNFAMKLLGQKRRREFCAELQEKLCQFPRLDNILFYTAHPHSRLRDQRIEHICQAYIDQYLDLETVAYLAHDFPFLKKYYLQYHLALTLAADPKQLDRLQNYRWGGQKEGDANRREEGRRVGCFLDLVNVAEQRIMECKPIQEKGNVCQICCKKMLKTQTFLECGKCRHGGHISHLLKWFQQYSNCPHIGCACLCN